jgi:hypothetical protein
MEIVLCECNFDIPGVERLPPHHHAFTGNMVGSGRYFEIGPFKGQEIEMFETEPYTIHIHVDWKKVAREL